MPGAARLAARCTGALTVSWSVPQDTLIGEVADSSSRGAGSYSVRQKQSPDAAFACLTACSGVRPTQLRQAVRTRYHWVANRANGVSVVRAGGKLRDVPDGRMGAVVNNADSGDEDLLDLADAITLLRDQVAEARRRIGAGHHAGVQFGLGEITVELGMELARTGGIDGGLRFSVVSFGGRHESSRKATHTVTVRLTPHLPGGGDVDVADQDDN